MTCYRESRYIHIRHRYWWRKPFSLLLLKSRGTSSIRTFWRKPVKKGKKSMPISMTDMLRLETFVFLESLSKRNTYMIYHCDSNVSNLRIYSLSSVTHFLSHSHLLDWYDSSEDLLYMFRTSLLSDRIYDVCDLMYKKRWTLSCTFSFYVSKEKL